MQGEAREADDTATRSAGAPQSGGLWRAADELPVERILHSAVRVPDLDGLLNDTLTSLYGEVGAGDERAPRLRALARNLPLVVWSVTPDGIMESSFGQGMASLGLQDGDLNGTSIDAWGDAGEASVRRALSGEPMAFETEGVFAEHAWAMKHLVVPQAGGGAIGVSVDVTERYLVQRELGASEGRFRGLAESAPIGIFLADPSGANLYTNPTLQLQFGLPAEQTLGRSWYEAVHPDDRARIDEHREGARARGERFAMEYRIVRPGGEERWLHVKSQRVFDDDDGAHIGYVGTTEDITERRASELALRETEELTRAILETAAEGIVTFDENGDILRFNGAAQRIFGWSADEVLGGNVGILLPDPHSEVYLGYLRGFRETGEATLAGMPPRELPGLRRDGSTVPIELAITEVWAHGQTVFTGLVRDISERKEFERQLEHQATHDPLTALPNRALLAAQLESSLARGYRHNMSVAVLFVNLDRVKLVTDSLGHRAGDELRVAAAHRLQGVVRPTDTVTRFGEDEFVVLAEDLHDIADAVAIAQHVIEAMDLPFDLTIDEAFISCNVGIAFAIDGLGTAESLIADADLAMFRAKEKGGSRFEIFDTEMREWINERRKIEVALRHALDDDEFELHYQPIVNVATGRVKGFEALIRWNRGDQGMVSPGAFIPVAEDSGLIIPMGEWILDDACRQIAVWQRDRPDQHLTVSVNLSGRQLAQRTIADSVARSLRESGADPSGLTIEITETVLLDDVEQAVRTLDALKDIGVKLSIDDFGTGYSSLTYLRRFPIDIVKVDQSFVSKLGTDSRDASIVKAVILLAEGLDLEVVAEGVETKEQLEALTAMECGFAQGYFFSRPKPVAELEEILGPVT